MRRDHGRDRDDGGESGDRDGEQEGKRIMHDDHGATDNGGQERRIVDGGGRQQTADNG